MISLAEVHVAVLFFAPAVVIGIITLNIPAEKTNAKNAMLMLTVITLALGVLASGIRYMNLHPGF